MIVNLAASKFKNSRLNNIRMFVYWLAHVLICNSIHLNLVINNNTLVYIVIGQKEIASFFFSCCYSFPIFLLMKRKKKTKENSNNESNKNSWPVKKHENIEN